MQELICFLEKWQILMGALIGGVVGLLAALLVARDARRREERAAAMLLIGDLAEVRNASEVLTEMSEKSNMTPDCLICFRRVLPLVFRVTPRMKHFKFKSSASA